MINKRLERFLIQLDSVDSTNNYANNLLRTGQVNNGTIILAHHQLEGRGQRSNTWTAEPGKNLTCSVILFPDIESRRAFYLNIVVSLAVRKCLSDLGLSAQIKWPNDILTGNKKICGILIENQLNGNKVASSIIGIGLNVNQREFGDLPNVTSVLNEHGSEHKIELLMDQIYGYLGFYYNLLLESNFELLLRHYYKHLYLLGVPSIFEDAVGRFEGVILGIDEDGMLLIQRQREKKRYDLKEIIYCH